MNVKKILAAVFIVFSLSFSYSNVIYTSYQKQAVVYSIESDKDNITDGFLKDNDKIRKKISLSLSVRIFILNSEKIYFNSS
ncbi:MAG TPA: hypothetical protein PK536_03445 [Ignavibacteria bacterium]|nr:hypothetical protein [Bacteroidota bacterium]HRI84482.1 hypothetical protein [Ignavibacteria bacterium]HRJ98864.1 hypothetical protein [Ignavibacteria bacterium]